MYDKAMENILTNFNADILDISKIDSKPNELIILLNNKVLLNMDTKSFLKRSSLEKSFIERKRDVLRCQFYRRNNSAGV